MENEERATRKEGAKGKLGGRSRCFYIGQSIE